MINLPDHALARLPLEHGEELLIVLPVERQPSFDFSESGPAYPYYQTDTDGYGETVPGDKVFGLADEDEGIIAPHRPGDVLEVGEEWQIADVDGWGDAYGIVYRADDPNLVCEWPDVPDEWQQKFGNAPDPRDYWRPAESMPSWTVRHRLTVQRVECKRVQELTEVEWRQTGLPQASIDDIKDAWNEDYLPQRPEFAFNRVWVWLVWAVSWNGRKGRDSEKPNVRRT